MIEKRRPAGCLRRARLVLMVLSIGLLVALLAACRPPPEALRVGVLAWPPYDLAYLAAERGYLDERDFELVHFQTPAEIVRSFRYGLLDAILVTSHFALGTAPDLGDVRIIYVVDASRGGDALLARPSVASAEALAGARIGVEAAPLGMYTLVRALNMLGLSREDVKIVPVDTADQFDAWRNGEIDALVTYEPTRSLVRKHGAVELFNSKAIPFEILDVLLVRARTIDSRRPALVEFIQGFDSALEAYRADPEATSAIMAERHPLTVEEFRQAMNAVALFNLEDNIELLGGDEDIVREALRQQANVMKETGMLDSSPPVDALIDASLVEEASNR